MTDIAKTQPFYLDCDTGIDDSLALAYLLSTPTVELKGVGTVSGNVGAAAAARNTLDLLHLAGQSHIPVAIGAQHPLAGRFHGGAANVHGDNGIGDVELPRSPIEPIPESAAGMLVRLAYANEGQLRIVAVGPLTNLAEALALEPRLPALVRDITIMGGAALVPGNITPVAEANIANDPEAASLVFEAPWEITLVPLDVTMSNVFEESHRQELLSSHCPVARTLGGMLERYFEFYLHQFGRRCSALHDPLAAAIAAGGIVPRTAPVVTVLVDSSAGPGRGQTICDLRGRHTGYPEQPGARCRVVLDITEDFAPHLVKQLLFT